MNRIYKIGKRVIRKSRMVCMSVKHCGWREAGIFIDKVFRTRYFDFGTGSSDSYVSHSRTTLAEIAAANGKLRASSGYELDVALKTLRIDRNDAIIDIGCGKGKAMVRLAKYPFGRIDGIERSPEWAQIANTNLSRLRLTDRSGVICADAETFRGLDDYSFFYLFNPFPANVMVKFIENVRVSIERRPRSVTLIYNNAMCDSEVVASGVFERVVRIDERTGINIYRSIDRDDANR